MPPNEDWHLDTQNTNPCKTFKFSSIGTCFVSKMIYKLGTFWGISCIFYFPCVYWTFLALFEMLMKIKCSKLGVFFTFSTHVSYIFLEPHIPWSNFSSELNHAASFIFIMWFFYRCITNGTHPHDSAKCKYIHMGFEGSLMMFVEKSVLFNSSGHLTDQRELLLKVSYQYLWQIKPESRVESNWGAYGSYQHCASCNWSFLSTRLYWPGLDYLWQISAPKQPYF